LLKNVCDEFVLTKTKKKNDIKKSLPGELVCINVGNNTYVNTNPNSLEEENLYQELKQIDLYSIAKLEIKNNK
jgi:hypothetical protein